MRGTRYLYIFVRRKNGDIFYRRTIVQDSLRTSLKIPVKTKNPNSRTILPLAGPPFGFELHEQQELRSSSRNDSPMKTGFARSA